MVRMNWLGKDRQERQSLADLISDRFVSEFQDNERGDAADQPDHDPFDNERPFHERIGRAHQLHYIDVRFAGQHGQANRNPTTISKVAKESRTIKEIPPTLTALTSDLIWSISRPL